ncbi:response regulator transcription factor [Pedobacter arcticus]|uniref:response regulator transcription factor n=1 Tax=Pedobacter arcticus TaxID=752140 RepID=UPI00145D3354|nr:response regulator transcription factor [Pedobacter arcticus]
MHKTPITIAIAEDNRFALKACLSKLSFYSDLVISMTAFNGQELLAQISKKQIDLILMDIQMPGMNGIETTVLIKRQHPQIKVLMLTNFDDDENIFKAIMAGADGYLLKEETAENLRNSIVETLAGGASMSAGIATRVLDLLRNPLQPKADDMQNYGLTKREVELLALMKNGLSYDQIATSLFISYGTVRKHIENIYRKLKVNSKMSAVDIASKNKLI